MGKLACPCGFVHNLTPVPDDGWHAIRDKDMEAYIQNYRAFEDGFNAANGSPEREAAIIGLREVDRMTTSLYECPECGRVMWQKEGEVYDVYLPEDPIKRDKALALASAENFSREQKAVRAEAIRIHNEAARIVAHRMPSEGIRCPHCLEFSKQMKFVEGHPDVWSYFQCPSCARTFGLERSGQKTDAHLA